MKRRVDEFSPWHCTHPCDHDAEGVKAWRYAVISGDSALSLIVSAKGGEFALHRSFAIPTDEDDDVVLPPGPSGQVFSACDLLKGGRCTIDGVSKPGWSYPVPHRQLSRAFAAPLGRRPVDVAIEFWKQHARQGQRDQPESFWRPLEALARAWAKDVRERRYPRVKCPKCGGVGFVKPKKKRA